MWSIFTKEWSQFGPKNQRNVYKIEKRLLSLGLVFPLTVSTFPSCSQAKPMPTNINPYLTTSDIEARLKTKKISKQQIQHVDDNDGN